MNTGFLKLLTVALIVVFFAVFLLLPIYTVVEEGLRWNLICEVFRNPLYMEGLLNSFLLGSRNDLSCVSDLSAACLDL